MKRYLNIDGSEQILKIHEEWPSFHDSEVISLCLDRDKLKGYFGPTITIKIHCFQITNQVVRNHYKIVKHNIITFAFYDLVEFELHHGFGQ